MAASARRRSSGASLRSISAPASMVPHDLAAFGGLVQLRTLELTPPPQRGLPLRLPGSLRVLAVGGRDLDGAVFSYGDSTALLAAALRCCARKFRSHAGLQPASSF